MRHAGALLLTVTLLASLSRSADGQSSPLRLIVNGQEVSLVASPIAYNGVLMIPLPGVFEPLGSSAVWLPEEQAVVISNRTRALIRLRINDPYALVGSDQRLLPIAPVLLRDIPFIPAAAVFGLLGAWVKFDEEERALRVSSVVSGITLQRPGGMLRLTVQASGPVQAETRRLTNPERMVIDL
ncbi:MAG: copper amine oxidase N-terminal domain-containing protein, partial [Armatimonadota bacterium]|nr:copper amine oxidase N-terminal domain-containing protein [Armatimonadota bacterium]